MKLNYLLFQAVFIKDNSNKVKLMFGQLTCKLFATMLIFLQKIFMAVLDKHFK